MVSKREKVIVAAFMFYIIFLVGMSSQDDSAFPGWAIGISVAIPVLLIIVIVAVILIMFLYIRK